MTAFILAVLLYVIAIASYNQIIAVPTPPDSASTSRLLGNSSRSCRLKNNDDCPTGQECYRGIGCIYPDKQRPDNRLSVIMSTATPTFASRAANQTTAADAVSNIRLVRRALLAVMVASQSFANPAAPQLTVGNELDLLCKPHQLRTQIHGPNQLSFIVYTHPKDNRTAIVGWEGTSNIIQWLTVNLRLNLVQCKLAPRCGRAFNGFQRAFLSLKDDLYRQIINYDRVVLTGHSLGGALSTMAALWLAYNQSQVPVGMHRVSVAGLYTFGSPRVGDEQMVNLAESLLLQQPDGATDSRRLVLNSGGPAGLFLWDRRDLVSLLPPSGGYQSFGPAVEITCWKDECDSITELHSHLNYYYTLYALWQQLGNGCVQW